MKSEKAFFPARVKIWNELLDEFEYGEMLRFADVPGFVHVCFDNDIAPTRIISLSGLELVDPKK